MGKSQDYPHNWDTSDDVLQFALNLSKDKDRIYVSVVHCVGHCGDNRNVTSFQSINPKTPRTLIFVCVL